MHPGRSSEVPLHVQAEMVAAGERPRALGALERPVPGVLAVVTGELVGAGEPPLTPGPWAGVRLLS